MSKRKTVTPPPTEPKPKYNIGQTVYAIIYHKTKPEELLEVEIVTVVERRYAELDYLGKKTGTGFNFSYSVRTKTSAMILMEAEIHPSFFEAAKVFAKAFLVLLK